MNKFFVPRENFCGDNVSIYGDDVKHIYKVLRLKIYDKVYINNCEGEEYLAEIENISKECVRVRLLERLAINNESQIELYLYQGVPKSAKMDLIVQKCSELGVRGITPIITERVVSKEINELKKVERWKRIALEACKQCKRTLIPHIGTPLEFQQMVEELKTMDLIMVPYENEGNYGIKKMIEKIKYKGIRKVAIVIGPEGGFEEKEIQKLSENGAFVVTLGPRILRTETAGFVSASIIMYELGDLGGVY